MFLRLLLLLAGLGLSWPGHAQQILCERLLAWPTTQNGYQATGLLQPWPDSLRLLGDYQVAATRNKQLPTTTTLRRFRVSSCDTLPIRNAAFSTQALFFSTYGTTSGALLTRQRTTLVGHSAFLSYLAYQPLALRLLSRSGQVKWTSYLPATSADNDRLAGLLEAPDKGFFITTTSYTVASLFRTDSLGNLLWRRRIGKSRNYVFLYAPSYGSNGAIRVVASYNGGGIGVLELSQNGDSLSFRSVSPDPSQVNIGRGEHAAQSLRDGGLLVTALVDSAGTGYRRPFLARLDANLNVVWTSVYRAQATNQYVFSHPFELADGSLLVLCHPQSLPAYSSLSGNTYYLLRYSAAGTLQQRYTFTSPALVALKQSGAYGPYGLQFNEPAGLQPLSDSTFVLADNVTAYPNNQQVSLTYLARLKVPGLRRVVNSTYIPAVNSPLPIRPALTDFPAPAFPNPARESVTVPLPASAGTGRLSLLDLAGRLVRTQSTAAGVEQATLPLPGLAPGMYVLRYERAGQPPATQRLAVGP